MCCFVNVSTPNAALQRQFIRGVFWTTFGLRLVLLCLFTQKFGAVIENRALWSNHLTKVNALPVLPSHTSSLAPWSRLKHLYNGLIVCHELSLTDIQCAQRVMPNDFGNPFTFPP